MREKQWRRRWHRGGETLFTMCICESPFITYDYTFINVTMNRLVIDLSFFILLQLISLQHLYNFKWYRQTSTSHPSKIILTKYIYDFDIFSFYKKVDKSNLIFQKEEMNSTQNSTTFQLIFHKLLQNNLSHHHFLFFYQNKWII